MSKYLSVIIYSTNLFFFSSLTLTRYLNREKRNKLFKFNQSEALAHINIIFLLLYLIIKLYIYIDVEIISINF